MNYGSPFDCRPFFEYTTQAQLIHIVFKHGLEHSLQLFLLHILMTPKPYEIHYIPSYLQDLPFLFIGQFLP